MYAASVARSLLYYSFWCTSVKQSSSTGGIQAMVHKILLSYGNVYGRNRMDPYLCCIGVVLGRQPGDGGEVREFDVGAKILSMGHIL